MERFSIFVVICSLYFSHSQLYTYTFFSYLLSKLPPWKKRTPLRPDHSNSMTRVLFSINQTQLAQSLHWLFARKRKLVYTSCVCCSSIFELPPIGPGIICNKKRSSTEADTLATKTACTFLLSTLIRLNFSCFLNFLELSPAITTLLCE